MKPVTFFRLLLAAATMVSLAGNSAHAILTHNGTVPLWFTVAWAAVPPLALPVTVHGAGVLAQEQGRGAAYKAVVAAVVLIAALAFVISFVALRDLTAAMGGVWIIPWLFPVLVDATASVATVALLVLDDASVGQGESSESESESPASSDDSTDSLSAALPDPATNTDMGDDPPVHHVTQPATCGDSPVSQFDDARDAEGASSDPLLALAHHLVTQRRTTLSVSVTHEVLVMHHAGASTRTIAGEVGAVSPATVGRLVKAAREASQSAGDHPALSLVG